MIACPNCKSCDLMITHPRGLERMRIFLTGKRKYFCIECNHPFRGPDRRGDQRFEVATDASVAQNT